MQEKEQGNFDFKIIIKFFLIIIVSFDFIIIIIIIKY